MSTTSDLVSHHYEKLPGTGDEVGRFNIIHIPSCRDATGIHVSVVVLNSLRTEAIEAQIIYTYDLRHRKAKPERSGGDV